MLCGLHRLAKTRLHLSFSSRISVFHFTSKSTTSNAIVGEMITDEKQTSMKSPLVQGEDFGEYLVERVTPIKELKATGYRLLHRTSGATIIHLDRPTDDNCTFSIGFRTHPEDSSGVAHVLEHTALCGSAKFPARDPFFKMLDRSLSTYMNAWTASDWTMYPFSTMNAADFSNLLTVYLDAVYHPNLSRLDFLQEGWRLARTCSSTANEGDLQGKYEVKGVVYNEMKGAHSSPRGLFATRHQQAMFPNCTYAHVSGGDPLLIPKQLTHEKLVAFHRKCYRPGNSLLYSYGNLDLVSHLHRLAPLLNQAHQAFVGLSKEAESAAVVPFTSPTGTLREFDEPKRVVVSGPLDPMGDLQAQNKVLVSFLSNDVLDQEETFRMSVLGHLLVEGPASPMYKKLIDANIGSEYAPGTGYDNSTSRAVFSVGLQGVRLADVDLVERIVFETLEALASGLKSSDSALDATVVFARNRVAAAVQQMELSMKKHSASFGLHLAQTAVDAWAHGVCPIEAVSFQKRIDSLMEEFDRDVNLFVKLINKYLVRSKGNKHVLTFVMKPDESHTEELAKAEAAMIEELTKNMSEEDEKRLELDSQALDAVQAADQSDVNKHLLPCLSISDVSPSSSVLALESISDDLSGRITALAGDVVYFKALVPIVSSSLVDRSNSDDALVTLLDDKEIALLPLLAQCLTELGNTEMSIDQFDERVRACSGGLNVSVVRSDGRNGRSELALSLSSHSLKDRMADMMNLLSLAVRCTNWMDVGRVRTILASAASDAMNGISSRGHAMAMCLSSSSLSLYRRRGELLNGLTQAAFLSKLSLSDPVADDVTASEMSSSSFASEMASVESTGAGSIKLLADRLRALAGKILAQQKMHFAIVSGSQEAMDSAMKLAQAFSVEPQSLLQADDAGKTSLDCQFVQSLVSDKMAVCTPFGTSFVGQSLQIDSSNVQLSANAAVLAKMITSKHLHREIREIGGAYGGGCQYSHYDGVVSFYSYRDPNPINTLSVVDGVFDWFIGSLEESTSFSEQDLLEAKLSVFSTLDSPLDLADQGLHYLQLGVTDQDRADYRKALLEQVDFLSLKQTAQSLKTLPRQTVVLLQDKFATDQMQMLLDRGFQVQSRITGLSKS